MSMLLGTSKGTRMHNLIPRIIILVKKADDMAVFAGQSFIATAQQKLVG